MNWAATTSASVHQRRLSVGANSAGFTMVSEAIHLPPRSFVAPTIHNENGLASNTISATLSSHEPVDPVTGLSATGARHERGLPTRAARVRVEAARDRAGRSRRLQPVRLQRD